MNTLLKQFPRVWCVDFEYREEAGEQPEPWCAVGIELRTGKIRTWSFSDGGSEPVYSTGPLDLVVAYAAEAEGKCIRRLGWPLPSHCLDLLPLFRASKNRFGTTRRSSLLDALEAHGLPHMVALDKERFRELAVRGAPFTGEEMAGLIGYCRADVETTARLLPLVCDVMPLAQALLMGRYTMRAVSSIQMAGVPVNSTLFRQIIESRDMVQARLIADFDAGYGVFGGGSFRIRKFAEFLDGQRIKWPTTPQGSLDLKHDTFKSQAQLYPQLRLLGELRKTLATFRCVQFCVGHDGRNRVALMPFASRTGRNQPKSSCFIYAMPSWMRHLIEAPPGKVLITIDYEQQEFLIGAALSGDRRMLEAYQSGDPYLHTAIMARAAPDKATKDSHPRERAQYKTALLAIQYGCGAEGLAHQVGCPILARELMQHHQQMYARFHEWTTHQVDRVLLGGRLQTPFGWFIQADLDSPDLNVRSIANWPVQAAGADILRVAALALVEGGFEVAATVHDSLLIVADVNTAEEEAREAERLMIEASSVVLGGHSCRVETKFTRPGGPYCGEPAPEMFKTVRDILQNSHE